MEVPDGKYEGQPKTKVFQIPPPIVVFVFNPPSLDGVEGKGKKVTDEWIPNEVEGWCPEVKAILEKVVGGVCVGSDIRERKHRIKDDKEEQLFHREDLLVSGETTFSILLDWTLIKEYS